MPLHSLQVQVARHDERIEGLEAKEKDTSQKLDTLRNWMMATLASAALSLLGIIISLIKK